MCAVYMRVQLSLSRMAAQTFDEASTYVPDSRTMIKSRSAVSQRQVKSNLCTKCPTPSVQGQGGDNFSVRGKMPHAHVLMMMHEKMH